jgi:hypothetical protein
MRRRKFLGLLALAPAMKVFSPTVGQALQAAYESAWEGTAVLREGQGFITTKCTQVILHLPVGTRGKVERSENTGTSVMENLTDG